MSTLTFEVEDAKAERLAEAARSRGVEVAQLLQQMTDDFLAHTILARTAGDTAFKAALAASVRENEELLRRLAK